MQTPPARVHVGTGAGKRMLYVTHVDNYGSYLKICGNLNRDALNLVRNKIEQLLHTCRAIDPTWSLTRQESLVQPGAIYLYKRMSGAAPADFEFLRARVLSVAIVNNARVQVEVDFIDYGYKSTVGSYELLLPEKPEELRRIPPLCAQCIVLGICNDWKTSEIEEISRMISQQAVEISIKMELDQYKFITMKWKDFNFLEYLIFQKDIGSPIANDLLLDDFNKLLQNDKEQQYQKNPKLNGNLKYDATKRLNNNNYKINSVDVGARPYDTAELVPVMPPVFSGPNNHHRQNFMIQPSTEQLQQQQFSTNYNLSSRLQQQQLGVHYQQQQLPAHLLSQQQFNTTLHRPRIPHTVGNLRSMYQGGSYVNLNGNSVFASTPTGMIAGGPFSGSQPLYQHPMQAAQPQKLQPAALLVHENGLRPYKNATYCIPHRSVSAATFKSNVLLVGSTYDVYVSFVENGPCLFSVQLASAQEELSQMMNRIERVPLKPLTEKPNLGTACIARYSEDGQLYRALIVGVQQNLCKVAYIDYGNAEMVQFRDLYEIPDEFLTFKPFAIRFTLSGYKELEPIDDSLKKAFKDLVIYHHCKLEVTPLEGPPLVQYCRLFLKEQNILNTLRQIQKKRLVYAKAEDLQSNDIVEIRYIDSPKHFYVQKVSNIGEFEQLMDAMFLYYNKNQMVPTKLILGAPCIVKYDNEWYRAEIMRADDTAIIVRHVDFGYEQKVTQNLLSNIAEKHLKLPRQAVQCCLKGFENNELNKDTATTQFEMLAEESNRKRRSFMVKVFRIQPDGVNLVNLLTKELNVMKKLYKLSIPFEQYLTLEKEDFHMNTNGGESRIQKASSVTSSSDAMFSLNSNKKNYQQQQQQQTNYKYKEQSKNMLHSSAIGSHKKQQKCLPSECDIYSSTSSNREQQPSRDLRSNSSSDYKKPQQQQQGNKRQQQQGQAAQKLLQNTTIESRSSAGQNGYNGSSSSFDSNTKQLQGKEMRNTTNNNNNKSPLKTPPTRGEKRPQNAPQGYSQSRNQQKKGNTTKMSPNNSLLSTNDSNNHNMINENIVEEYVGLDHVFPIQPLETPFNGMDVIICWWISPYQFYTHLKKRSPDFERLMSEMQRFYKKKPLEQLQLRVGANVVARHRQDNMVYRARVIGCNHMLRKYKVHFVDYGNQYTVTSEDIWQVEKRFANFPSMSYLCSFNNFITNYDHLHIIDCMEKYLPVGATITCDYVERVVVASSKNTNNNDMYYVNVQVNGKSLRDLLKVDGLITEVPPELQLDLFAGQQIRAKICDIKDLLNFKIQIEGQSYKFLSSYDDVRYVKSNPNIAKKFREFYEGKSCVLNIKDVNDNKVILLRQLLPLFKEEVVPYICPPAVCMKRFTVRIVHVASATRLYGHPSAYYEQQQKLLDDMFEFYENNGEILKSFELEEICAAQSEDANWYRARIESVDNDIVRVFYIDYGNTEQLNSSQLKCLEREFYEHKSSYALEINLPIRVPQDSEKAKKNSEFLMNKLKDLVMDLEFDVDVLEMRKNHLIADLYDEKNQSILSLLDKQRDVDNVRKQLDKDKKNIYEYYETVDLTLEDEMDDNKKSKGKLASLKKQKKPKATAATAEESTLKKSPIKTPIEDSFENDEFLTTKTTTTTTTKDNANQVEELLDPIEIKILTNETFDSETEKIDASIESNDDEKKNSTIATTTTTSSTTTATSSNSGENDAFAGMEKAYLSHCDNPAQFFIHAVEDVEELRKLQENLQIVASSLPPLMGLHTGAHCICSYSMDKKWYRARVIDADVLIIKFIDYGNTDCVTDSDLKEMSVFPDIEPFCKPCALPIKPNCKLEWAYAANTIFNESFNKMLHFQYLTRGDNEKRSFINLFVDGINVAEKLVEDGYAKYLEIVQSGLNCYLSHVNGINDFYIQYEKDSKALELIEMYFEENAEQLKRIERFEKSRIVAALFPDDGMWYRAKLLNEMPDNNYEVHFIDYGNTSITSDCREISEEITQAAPLSKHCSLEVPENCAAWSHAAEVKFNEIAAQGEITFTVELREPTENWAEVHLYIDGININDDLLPLCAQVPPEQHENTFNIMNQSFCNTTLHSYFGDAPVGTVYKGVVCAVHDVNDFYVHFSMEQERLQDMSSSLQTLARQTPLLKEVQVKDNVAALVEIIYDNKTEEKLYRASILDIFRDSKEQPVQWRVFLLDYGTEHYTTELHALPLGLEQVSPFAKHCQLQLTDELAAYDINTLSFAFKHFECMLSETLLNIELIQNEWEPAVVKLIDAKTNENVCSKIQQNLSNKQIEEVSMPKAETPTVLKNDSCVISHALTPTHFFIQRKSNLPQLKMLTKALEKIHAEKLEEMPNPIVDELYVAFAEEEDFYYRARVMSRKQNGTTVVKLIDQGNIINCNNLRILPKELMGIPPLAEKCALNGMPESCADNKELWATQFCTFVEEHFGEFFEIEAEKRENDVNLIEMCVNFKNVVECLTKKVELAVKCSNEKEAATDLLSPLRAVLHDCNIIHVNSPEDFYIQLSEDLPALENITDKLLDAATNFEPVIFPLTVGCLCAALFPDDEIYYRARILQVLADNNYEVHYIDFGNNAITDQVRQLPEDMLELEACAKNCSLYDLPETVSVAMCEQFQALVDARFTETFQVEFLKTTVQPQICRVFFNQRNMAKELLDMLKTDYVEDDEDKEEEGK